MLVSSHARRAARRFERWPSLLVQASRGVLFHDGAELTAADVKRSIERTLAPETPCPAPTFYASISGFEEFHNGKKDAAGKVVFAPHLDGVVVDGRYALHIDLSQTDATFLPVMTLAFVAPVCKSAGEQYTREWGNHACGTGPFRLTEWQSSREISLTRHDGYFEPGLPYLDKVRWFLLMPPLTQRFKFEDGELDHLRELRLPDLIYYRTDPEWRKLGQWEAPKSTSGIFLNTQMAPFDNIELRRAFAAAIDWTKIADAKPEQVVTANQMVPPAVPGHDPTFQGQRYDPAAALEHMKRAGYPYDPATRTGGYPGVVRYRRITDHAWARRDGSARQTAGRADRHPHGAQADQLAGLPRRAGQAQHGAARLWRLVHGFSRSAATSSSPSSPPRPSRTRRRETRAFFSNPELDRLLKEAHSELDPVRRAALYRRCEEIVRDERRGRSDSATATSSWCSLTCTTTWSPPPIPKMSATCGSISPRRSSRERRAQLDAMARHDSAVGKALAMLRRITDASTCGRSSPFGQS